MRAEKRFSVLMLICIPACFFLSSLLPIFYYLAQLPMILLMSVAGPVALSIGIGISFLWIGALAGAIANLRGFYISQKTRTNRPRYRYVYGWEGAVSLVIIGILIAIGNALSPPSRGGFITLFEGLAEAMIAYAFFNATVCAAAGLIATAVRRRSIHCAPQNDDPDRL